MAKDVNAKTWYLDPVDGIRDSKPNEDPPPPVDPPDPPPVTEGGRVVLYEVQNITSPTQTSKDSDSLDWMFVMEAGGVEISYVPNSIGYCRLFDNYPLRLEVLSDGRIQASSVKGVVYSLTSTEKIKVGQVNTIHWRNETQHYHWQWTLTVNGESVYSTSGENITRLDSGYGANVTFGGDANLSTTINGTLTGLYYSDDEYFAPLGSAYPGLILACTVDSLDDGVYTGNDEGFGTYLTAATRPGAVKTIRNDISGSDGKCWEAYLPATPIAVSGYRTEAGDFSCRQYEERWYGWRTYVPSSYAPTQDTPPGSMIWQFHPPNDQYPLFCGYYDADTNKHILSCTSEMISNGTILVGNDSVAGQPSYIFDAWSKSRDTWADFMVNAKWTAKSNGFFKLYLDNTLVWSYEGPTNYGAGEVDDAWDGTDTSGNYTNGRAGVYYKHGQYRPWAEDNDTNIIHNWYRVGINQTVVNPANY